MSSKRHHRARPEKICEHCKHASSYHWYGGGPCHHLAYANGPRCPCAQFQVPVDKR